ncbi:N-acetylglucosamine-6-phosphate deacetylase [Nocardioides sp. CPCC 206347]|uniref:N-acetylglucosamine-6-phosphate deacetylase n=1 Tax=unclassified Nocardioides TaxID=2615069 RepID=UPI00361EC453
MADLRIVGGVDAAGQPVEVAIVGGHVVDDGPRSLPTYDAGGLHVLPGLIDLQVNGVAGLDLTLEPERLWEVASALPRWGVTAFLPTIITSGPDSREAAMAVLAAGPPAGWRGAVPLGLHLEGPMLAPARKGAHPEHWLRVPAPELVEGWSRANGVALVTIAPEFPGALEVIADLTARGVLVAIGHTDATSDQVLAAVDRGARLVTHLGNAMPPFLGREPGPIAAALADPRLTAGVIADGHHLHPTTLAAFWQALGPDRFLAVTDCTAALGLPDGPTRLGEQHVVVGGGTVRLEDGTLAGSAVDLPQCLAVLRSAAGCGLAHAVATATAVPARVLGDRSRGTIAAGARGDLTLVDDELEVAATVVGGHLLHGEMR